MDLHLYNYNNYYNRRIKPVDLTSANPLGDMQEYELYVETDVNFNPNDGIMTTHTIGGVHNYSGTADYAIVASGGTIISCWFVIENKRIRGGQYEVLLKRDTVAENLDSVLAAPCFVEKGWVPSSDPAVFNKENLTFNQIKTKEVLLKDETKTPWLVGYYEKNKTIDINIPATSSNADITVYDISSWEYYNYTTTAAKSITELQLYLAFTNKEQTGSNELTYYLTSKKAEYISEYNGVDKDNYYRIDKSQYESLTNQLNLNASSIFSAGAALYDGYVSLTTINTLESQAGRTIYDSKTGKLYKVGANINLGFEATAWKHPTLTSTFGYTIYNAYAAAGVLGSRPTSDGAENLTPFTIKERSVMTIQLSLTEVSTAAYTLTINPGNAGQTQNAPYNIFAIPYGGLTVGFPEIVDDQTTHTYKKISEDLAYRLANAVIATKKSTGELYDLQLLPYCPIDAVRTNLQADSTRPILHLDEIDSALWVPIKDQENNNVGVCFNCTSTSVSFTINETITVDDIKISNETEFCRLVSPNWNGMFEFTPAKNLGVRGFTVDYELKPFQPYIHVAPIWNSNGLYGRRDNDAIGLICGGDFGLSMISDAWAQYEMQNKNYQQIFDRGIQNLEVTQKHQRISEQVGIIVGGATGATTGAMTGGMMGGGYGAVAGAVVGGVSSVAGGIVDYNMNEALRNEAMDYTKDLFGYQMDNIKALPDSLTKVNSFNPNNHLFPILEYYSATDEEKTALRRKILYNGMSIGRIDTLSKFKNPSEITYLKGQIIELNIDEDSHFVNDIANEIYKGVRI